MNVAAYLILFIFNGPGNGSYIRVSEMSSMQACYDSVKNSKQVIANGGDSEGGFVLYCSEKLPESKQ